MNLDMKSILKSPIIDLWASILEGSIMFVLKMEAENSKSLTAMFYSILDLQFKRLFFDLAIAGLPFILSVLLMLYIAMKSIRWFNALSYLLLVGSSLHLTMKLLDPSIDEYFCYMLIVSAIGFLFALYYTMETSGGLRHPFFKIAEAIKEHPMDFLFILFASAVKAFMFVWFFSGSRHGGMSRVKVAIFTFFEVAAMSSLMYNIRTGVILLMTVNKSRDICAYIKLIIRRASFVGTVCLAGILRPIVSVVYLIWKSLSVFGIVRPPLGKYTLARYEISLFYSILHNVSLLEGRKLAEQASEDRLPFHSVEFKVIPGLFIPYCFSLVYILSSSVGRYAQYFTQPFIYLYFVLLHLMFLEFLYSVITTMSIIDRQKNESVL